MPYMSQGIHGKLVGQQNIIYALLLRDESKEPKNTCIVNLFSDPRKQSIQNNSYSCPVLDQSNNLHKINYTIVQCYISRAL